MDPTKPDTAFVAIAKIGTLGVSVGSLKPTNNTVRGLTLGN
jgi:hypothetical protein